MFGKKGVFGRKTSAPSSQGMPQPPVDSDGQRRIFGEEIYAKHGDFLRALGRDINDPDNLLPTEEDHQRKTKESLARQEQRRCQIEAELLQKHGLNAIRPFFVLGEPVMNSRLGLWLMRVMELQPYEDWNLEYLPTDAATAAALNLPLHPGCSIKPIDDLMIERIGSFFARYEDARTKTDAVVREGRDDQFDVIERFIAYKDKMRQDIIDYVLSVKPMIVGIIAEVQSKG